MEQENEAPKPVLISSVLSKELESKPLEIKKLELKGKDEELYSINFQLFENSLKIEAIDLNDISSTKYMSNLTLDDFKKFHFFFSQFQKIEEIFELLKEMQTNEFMIKKNNSEEINFYLLVEIRKKINEIKIDLKVQKTDINKIVYNLCEKVKEFKEIKEEIKIIKENVELKKEISLLKKNNENLENSIKLINEKLDNKVKEDNIIINKLKEEINFLKEIFENI